MAAQLLVRPHAQTWGYQLAKALGLTSAQVSIVLAAMLDDGWLTAHWEDPESVKGRSPRRYYELTELGREQLPDLAYDAATPRTERTPR